MNVVLLFLVLEIAVLSLERADWFDSPVPLSLVLVLAMLAVWLLIKTRLHGFLVHVLSLVIGAVITYGLVSGRLGSGGDVFFAIFLIYLVWVIGYISTWFYLQRKNGWVAVCLGTLVILVNLSNLPDSYYYFFGLYFVASVLLIVRTRISRREGLPESGLKPGRRNLLYFSVITLCLVALAVTISWAIPQARIPQLQTMIATRILWKQDIEKSRFNIFAAVPSKQPLITASMLKSLPFGESWHWGDRIEFVVISEQPSYWQVHVYDTYTSEGWTNRPSVESLQKSRKIWKGAEIAPGAGKLEYTVITGTKASELLTTGAFVSADTPVLVNESDGDIISVKAPRLLGIGEKYTVTVAVTDASPTELYLAGEDYPESILKTYLQLPPEFPESVRELTEEVVSGKRTPYQKVLAIRDYLASIPYETKVEVPPEGTDGVEFFLLEQREGFCIHYASSAAVMLRSVGVPSRIAVGYLPGEPGEKAGEYVLRDKQYHTWPQVYFPGYGWIDIEVTPSGYVAAGSEVTLETPWVSRETISELPQWDIWEMMALYGADYFQEGTTTVSSVEYPRKPGRQLPFADELGQALLIIFYLVLAVLVLMTPLLLLRSFFYRWVWNVDRANLALTTYDKMCRLSSMVRLGPQPHQTPLEYTADLKRVYPEEANALDRITGAYLECRFGGRKEQPSLFEEAEILKARCSIFHELLRRLGLAGKIWKRQ